MMKKVTCLFSNYTYFYMYVHSCSWYILCTRNNLYLFISFTSRSLTMSPDVLVVIVSGKRCYLDLSFKGVLYRSLNVEILTLFMARDQCSVTIKVAKLCSGE